METFESRIENHQPLVISLAQQIHKRLPRFITYDDVVSYGQVGLAQASRTYQPQPGTKFSSYAYYRIKGAIYDGIARMNWTTRAEYRKYKAMQMANATVAANSDDSTEPSQESDARWFANNVESLAMVYVFSSADSENPFENQLLGDDVAPDEAAENNELSQKLHEAIKNLPDDEKQLVTLTYFERQSLAEAASQLGKSRSWGSRTHARIRKTLGSELLGTCDP